MVVLVGEWVSEWVDSDGRHHFFLFIISQPFSFWPAWDDCMHTCVTGARWWQNNWWLRQGRQSAIGERGWMATWVCVGGWMDGWEDGWMGGWMGGWMDGRVGGSVGVWVGGWMGGWRIGGSRSVGVWVRGWMDG